VAAAYDALCPSARFVTLEKKSMQGLLLSSSAPFLLCKTIYNLPSNAFYCEQTHLASFTFASAHGIKQELAWLGMKGNNQYWRLKFFRCKNEIIRKALFTPS
jgi:hypothetical protein